MGRNVSGAAAGSAVVGGNKNLRCNQASGYANVSGQSSSTWIDWGGWWSNQFSTSNMGYTISDATSFVPKSLYIIHYPFINMLHRHQ